jgi:putative ATPase
MKELGYGKRYRYAHDEPEAYAAGEDYFPRELGHPRYYLPVDRGLEIRIREKLAHLEDLDRTASKVEAGPGDQPGSGSQPRMNANKRQ